MMKTILILEQPKMKSQMTKFTVESFRRGYVNGQKFVSLPEILAEYEFESILLDFGDFLTPAEIIDVEESWREIEEGKAKKFESTDEFLEELKK